MAPGSKISTEDRVGHRLALKQAERAAMVVGATASMIPMTARRQYASGSSICTKPTADACSSLTAIHLSLNIVAKARGSGSATARVPDGSRTTLDDAHVSCDVRYVVTAVTCMWLLITTIVDGEAVA